MWSSRRCEDCGAFCYLVDVDIFLFGSALARRLEQLRVSSWLLVPIWN